MRSIRTSYSLVTSSHCTRSLRKSSAASQERRSTSPRRTSSGKFDGHFICMRQLTIHSSHHGVYGIKCSIKASEGFLYCLEKAFMFVPKPATYISYEQLTYITFSRVGGAISASRTFDITVHGKDGVENQFSNINREEQKSLEDFFK